MRVRTYLVAAKVLERSEGLASDAGSPDAHFDSMEEL